MIARTVAGVINFRVPAQEIAVCDVVAEVKHVSRLGKEVKTIPTCERSKGTTGRW